MGGSMRYVRRQGKDLDCAQIALVNMIKFCGQKISYSEYKELFRSLGYRKKVGTYYTSLVKSIKFFNLPIKRAEDINNIESLFKNDTPCIIKVLFNKKGISYGHFSFVEKITANRLYAINLFRKQGKYITKSYLKRNHKNIMCWRIDLDTSKL